MRFGKLVTFCISIFLLLNNITPVTFASASLFSDKEVKPIPEPIIGNPNQLITLTEDNLVVLRGAIDEDSASYFIKDIHRLIANEKVDDIYVYLMTPGGSVIHGYDIIQTLEALSQTGKKIHCIADTAYSMGFSILQACDSRHVLKSSSIMQHQMSFGFEGHMENNKNRFKFIESIEEKMTEQQSSRLGL